MEKSRLFEMNGYRDFIIFSGCLFLLLQQERPTKVSRGIDGRIKQGMAGQNPNACENSRKTKQKNMKIIKRKSQKSQKIADAFE